MWRTVSQIRFSNFGITQSLIRRVVDKYNKHDIVPTTSVVKNVINFGDTYEIKAHEDLGIPFFWVSIKRMRSVNRSFRDMGRLTCHYTVKVYC